MFSNLDALLMHFVITKITDGYGLKVVAWYPCWEMHYQSK